jgi:hypothetical protein
MSFVEKIGQKLPRIVIDSDFRGSTMSAQIVLPFLALAIPILGIVGWVVTDWLRFKEKQIGAISADTAEKAAQYAAKTERLEQRVAVLERILTDRSTVLADEIDRLRDAPVN